MTEETQNAKTPRKGGQGLSLTALALSLITPLFIGVAMLGTMGGQFDYELGFKTLTLNIAPNMAIVAFAIALLVLLISIFRDPKRSGLIAMAAAVISGSVVFGFYLYGEALKSNPPIYDVATDWSRPVTLSDALVKARGSKSLRAEDDPSVPDDASIKWARKRVADINAETCPGAKPILRRLDPAQVRKTIEGMGYAVTGSAPWRIEALYTSPFFGLESDLIIRLDPDRTDVRSVSRLQEADLGGNCAHVTKVVTALRKL